jgi:hypothetical protein
MKDKKKCEIFPTALGEGGELILIGTADAEKKLLQEFLMKR